MSTRSKEHGASLPGMAQGIPAGAMPPLLVVQGKPADAGGRLSGSSASEGLGATILHELVHWAGAKHRLARFAGPVKKEDIAAEELVAELGAAFLCADLGVSNAPRPDHAAYVAHWLQLLKNDTRAIFTASRLANQAAMYLHELASAGEW